MKENTKKWRGNNNNIQIIKMPHHIWVVRSSRRSNHKKMLIYAKTNKKINEYTGKITLPRKFHAPKLQVPSYYIYKYDSLHVVTMLLLWFLFSFAELFLKRHRQNKIKH